MSKSLRKRTYWCDSCHVPLLNKKCLACGNIGRDFCAANLVPIFRPEISHLKKHIPTKLHQYFIENETWVSPSHHLYYYQGIPIIKYSENSVSIINEKQLRDITPYKRTKSSWLKTLKKANKDYIEKIQYEAEDFIRNTIDNQNGKTTLISFSGGKDSTVVSHLVMNAIGRSDILHIFADTTIEFPDTYKYLQYFQQQHPLTPFIQSRSKLSFFNVAESIGPPSRILRWCCTTHKTNPLAKLIDSMSPDKGVLTFDGVRKYESPRRANYPRLSKKHKIARETLARPILEWSDLQVWIYLLYHELTFNHAYKKGFRRVGCLFCPFNSTWSRYIIKNRYSNKDKKWTNFLHKQAHRMNHKNPDSFIGRGWRVRAGGRGLDHYKSKVESTPCIVAESAVMYQLLSGDIRIVRNFLRPLGPQTFVDRSEYSETFLIHNLKTKEILASVEVSYLDEAIRVNYLLKKYKRLFQQRIEKQLKKLQVCVFCGACGAKCKLNALDSDDNFVVEEKKCSSCNDCVSFNCPILDSLKYKG